MYMYIDDIKRKIVNWTKSNVLWILSYCDFKVSNLEIKSTEFKSNFKCIYENCDY